MWTSGWSARKEEEERGGGEQGEMALLELAFAEGMCDLLKWKQRGGLCRAKGTV